MADRMTNARFQQRLGRRDRFFIGCCCVWGLFLLFLVAVVLFLKKKVKTAGLVSLTPSSRFFFKFSSPWLRAGGELSEFFRRRTPRRGVRPSGHFLERKQKRWPGKRLR